MKYFSLLCAAALAVSASIAAAEPVSPAVAKAHLAKVPATDPKPTATVSLLPALQGQHPRLLFTKAEIEKLKGQIATDPILKRTYADISQFAKKFTLAKAWQPKAILTDDTSAITMLKSWPALAYVYAIERDPSVKQAIVDILTMMLEAPAWADTAEYDANMGAGENMMMTGLLFDAVYNDLEPDFRAKMAAKILTQSRRMYYLGHQKLGLMPIKYWQGDPANNHRWHRDAGLSACMLAIADEKNLDTGYMMQQLKQEMDFVTKWYTPDGECAEGAGYQTFGFFYIASAADMMDRNLGTKYLDTPGFRHAWAQQVYYNAPGRQGSMSFGDDMNGEGIFDNLEAAFFLSPKLSRDKDVQAIMIQRFMSRQKNPTAPTRPYSYPWALLAFYDPTVGTGDVSKLPTMKVFPDIGAATMRNSWKDDAVCVTFKCGPYGGHTLNAYAHANADASGNPLYINVAHSDPDANEFALGMNGALIFHPGLYSLHKMTSSHSTITVDGKGQINEGNDYTQPIPKTDMRKLCYLTGWKTDAKGRVMVEGEAGQIYQDKALQHFRRSMIYMPGEYVLILDDIAANGAHTITWHGTVEKAQFEDPATGRCYAYTKNGKERVDFQMLANKDFTGAIDFAFLDGRFGSQLMQQFQFSAKTDAIKFACLLDPWKTKPTLTLKEEGSTVKLTVTSATFTDTWTWRPAKDSATPSDIACTRGGAPLIALTLADLVKVKEQK